MKHLSKKSIHAIMIQVAAKVSEKYQEIFSENKKAVSYMVKEFEMKKSLISTNVFQFLRLALWI